METGLNDARCNFDYDNCCSFLFLLLSWDILYVENCTLHDWLHGYHESERQWVDTARSMQLWFIITSIQRYGHLAWDPRNAGRWSWVYEDHGHLARDPHDTGILLRVTVLMVWNGELEIRFYYWPCDHLASYGVVHYHKHTNIWSCSPRSKKSRHIIVNYLCWL